MASGSYVGDVYGARESMDWAVSLTAMPPLGAESEASDPVAYGLQVVAVLEKFGAADVVASVSRDRVAVTFALEAREPDRALSEGVAIWRKAASDLAVDAWPLVRIAAASYGALGDEYEASALPRLVGVGEVAKILGVSKQRVSALHSEQRLPIPIAKLASGPVWAEDGIQRFMDSRRQGQRSLAYIADDLAELSTADEAREIASST